MSRTLRICIYINIITYISMNIYTRVGQNNCNSAHFTPIFQWTIIWKMLIQISLWESISIVDRLIYLLYISKKWSYFTKINVKMSDLTEFQKRRIVWARMAGACHQNGWTAWFLESYHIKDHDGIQEALKKPPATGVIPARLPKLPT